METQIVEIQGDYYLHYFKIKITKEGYANHRGTCYRLDFFAEKIAEGNHDSLGGFGSEKDVKRFISFTKALVKMVPDEILTRRHFMKWYVNSLKSCRITDYGIEAYPWIEQITY